MLKVVCVGFFRAAARGAAGNDLFCSFLHPRRCSRWVVGRRPAAARARSGNARGGGIHPDRRSAALPLATSCSWRGGGNAEGCAPGGGESSANRWRAGRTTTPSSSAPAGKSFWQCSCCRCCCVVVGSCWIPLLQRFQITSAAFPEPSAVRKKPQTTSRARVTTAPSFSEHCSKFYFA